MLKLLIKLLIGVTYKVYEPSRYDDDYGYGGIIMGLDGIYDITNAYTNSSSYIWNNSKAKNWLSQWYSYSNGKHKTSGDNKNLKAVAYMMDTSIWTTKFTTNWKNFDGLIDYAIGGPTLELFCASYKDTHPDKYIVSRVNGDVGYEIAWNENGNIGEYTNWLSKLTGDNYNKNIYLGLGSR